MNSSPKLVVSSIPQRGSVLWCVGVVVVGLKVLGALCSGVSIGWFEAPVSQPRELWSSRQGNTELAWLGCCWGKMEACPECGTVASFTGDWVVARWNAEQAASVTR